MSIRRMTYEEWAEALALTHGKPDYAKFMGSSPGGAAVELGVTRQRVWQLLKEGKLDLLLLADNPKAKVSAWIIPHASVKRLLKSRPMEQADLLLSKPQVKRKR